MFVKVKIDVKGKNSGLYLFSPTIPNKEILNRFNLKTPKEDFMRIYTDTLFENHESIIGNTCAQIFTGGKFFVYVHFIRSKSQAVKALNVVTRYVGVPNTLISYNAGKLTGPQI